MTQLAVHSQLFRHFHSLGVELKAENVIGMVSVAVLKTNWDDEESFKDNSDDLLTTPGVDETPSGVHISGDLGNIQKLKMGELVNDEFTDTPGLTNLILMK